MLAMNENIAKRLGRDVLFLTNTLCLITHKANTLAVFAYLVFIFAI